MKCILKTVNLQAQQGNHLCLNFYQFSLTAAKEDPIHAIDFHMSFQEFFAGLYLSDKILKGETDFERHLANERGNLKVSRTSPFVHNWYSWP